MAQERLFVCHAHGEFISVLVQVLYVGVVCLERRDAGETLVPLALAFTVTLRT